MTREELQVSAPLQGEYLIPLIAAIFRRKILLLSVFAAVAGIAVLVALIMPRRYESRMKVLVKNERADLVVSPDARDSGQARGDVSEAQVNSEIELLTSNDLLVRVVRATRLYQRTPSTSRLTAEPSQEAIERAVRRLRDAIAISAVKKANVIQIVYADSSAELAASVLKELSAAYLDAHLRIHSTAGSQDFFRDQTERYENELREAETRLSTFRSTKNLTSVADQKDLLLRKTIDFDTTLQEVDATIAETDSRVRDLRTQVAAQDRRIVTQMRVVPNQYSVERLTTMLAELENRRTLALLKFRSGDPMILEITEEITNTRDALDKATRLASKEESSDINPLRASLEGDLARAELQEASLRARRKSVAAALAVYRARLAEVEKASIEHDELERQRKQAEENYVLYSRKQEESRIADSLDQQKIANVAIAEYPTEPHLPASSSRLLSIGLGLVLAAFASAGVVVASEWIAAPFHTPAQLEAATGYPVLATIPFERT